MESRFCTNYPRDVQPRWVHVVLFGVSDFAIRMLCVLHFEAIFDTVSGKLPTPEVVELASEGDPFSSDFRKVVPI